MGEPLYAQHLDAVRAFLSSRERDPQARADLEAEFAEKARHLRPHATSTSRIRSFFVAVAANLLRHHQRRQALEAERLLELEQLGHASPEDPEVLLARKQEIAEVLDGISRLPKAHRDALLLTAVEGLTPREAAQQEGVPEATFRTRVFWARRNLEALLRRTAPSKRTRAALALLVVVIVSSLSYAMLRVWSAWRAQQGSPPTPHERSVPPPSAPPPSAPPPAAPNVSPASAPARPAPMEPKPKAQPSSQAPHADDLALYESALALQLAGHNAEAAEAWSRFISGAAPGPYRSEALYRRALAWARDGKWAIARPALEALVRDDNESGIGEEAVRLLSAAPPPSAPENAGATARGAGPGPTR